MVREKPYKRLERRKTRITPIVFLRYMYGTSILYTMLGANFDGAYKECREVGLARYNAWAYLVVAHRGNSCMKIDIWEA